jgi:outer membrane lipoprotein LolB
MTVFDVVSRAAARRSLRALVIVAAGVLAACSSPPRRDADADIGSLDAQLQREEMLSSQTQWSLVGKIAVSDGRDGGSGRIDWQQQGDRFRIEIRAPVSRQTWRLSGGPDGATLEGLDGGPRSGPDAEALLRDAVGWTVPVADMIAWARGARGEGAAEIEFGPEGLPSRLHQRGWTVEYRAWGEGEPLLPRKVFAASGERRVRLVVERWDAGVPRG